MLRQNSAERERRIRLILRLARLAAVFVLVGGLALFEYLCPLRSLLPAARILKREDGELRLHFLSAGAGECTAIEFPEGDVLVVDGGDGGFQTRVSGYIRGLNPESVSVVLTNPKAAHVGGLTELLSCVTVREVYLPAVPAETGAYRRFVNAAEEKGCEIKRLTRYGVISRPSGAYAVCLSPYSAGETDADEASVALYLQYGEFRALLSSDMTAAREERLLNEYAIDEGIFDSGDFSVRLPDINVLRVAGGGSDASSCKPWLSFLNAETAIVSCGRGAGTFSGAVAARLHEAGAEIYRTDELGHIVVSVCGGEYRVLTHVTE